MIMQDNHTAYAHCTIHMELPDGTCEDFVAFTVVLVFVNYTIVTPCTWSLVESKLHQGYVYSQYIPTT